MCIIGIVGRNFYESNLNRPIIGITEDYRKSIIKLGAVPFIINPPQLVNYYSSIPEKIDRLTEIEKEILIRQLEMCDGVLFPGGSKRFEYDLFILNYCIEKDMPVLGTCLGMQICSMIDKNGNYVNHNRKIESNIEHSKLDNKYAHEVIINKNSKLYSIIEKEKILVNSRHRYEVVDPETFSVSAKSEDGVIEAIERKDKRFMIGVQWHPEMLAVEDDEDAIKIIKAFINAAKEYRNDSKI